MVVIIISTVVASRNQGLILLSTVQLESQSSVPQRAVYFPKHLKYNLAKSINEISWLSSVKISKSIDEANGETLPNYTSLSMLRLLTASCPGSDEGEFPASKGLGFSIGAMEILSLFIKSKEPSGPVGD